MSAFEAKAMLRFLAVAKAHDRRDPFGADPLATIRWTDDLIETLTVTLERVRERNLVHAGPAHFVQAALRHRAAVGAVADSDGLALQEILKEFEKTELLDRDAEPLVLMLELLAKYGYVHKRPLRLGPVAALARALNRRIYRTGPIIDVLREQAVVECVRLGHERVAPVHVFLAVAQLAEQRSVSPRLVRFGLLPFSEFPTVLEQHQVDYRSLFVFLASIPDSTLPTRNDQSADGIGSSYWPMWTMAANDVFESAVKLASARWHKTVGADHVLAAILESGDSGVAALFGRIGVDPEAGLADLYAVALRPSRK